jgi:histidinol-phosphate aminotransferase
MKSSYKSLKLSVPEEIASLVPYPPGKPIEELERELGIEGSIKLASNENPIGPSMKAVEAISKALTGLNRYPDGSCYYLKNNLSVHLGVPPESIIIGNGSNEIIELLVRTFLSRGDEAIMGDPSFAVYPLVVQAACCRPIKVPMKALTIDLEAMAGRITKKTRLVFIANPNNPTGTIVTTGEFRKFMDSVPEETIVCIDEAYYEFVTSPEFPDSLEYIKEGRAVVILRSFSKTYGLAGLRVGYGISHPDIIDYMNRVRQPFNVNSLAQVAALAALEDKEHLNRTLDNNASGLKYLFLELKKLNYECVPTEANFFLLKVGDGRAVFHALASKGVIVRPMHSFGLSEYIRVSVGLPEENRRFIKTFREVVGQKV